MLAATDTMRERTFRFRSLENSSRPPGRPQAGHISGSDVMEPDERGESSRQAQQPPGKAPAGAQWAVRCAAEELPSGLEQWQPVQRMERAQQLNLRPLRAGEHVHVPARSGRHREHAQQRAMGSHARHNTGNGKGNARGTQLAQQDFRAATFTCDAAGCAALVDLHWARRQAGSGVPPGVGDGCTACGHGRARKQNLEGQYRMAAALENGERRLVYRDGHLIIRSKEDLLRAIDAARAQASQIASGGRAGTLDGRQSTQHGQEQS